MRWRTLKTVVILLLAAANVFFILKIVDLTKDRTAEINEETDASIIEIMANDGIEVPKSLIRHGTESVTAFRLAEVDDYTADLRTKLTGTADCIYDIYEDDTRTVMVSGGTQFKIESDGSFEMLRLEYGDSVAGILADELTDVKTAKRDEITLLLRSIFAHDLDGKLSATVDSVGVTDGGVYVCRMSEAVSCDGKTTDITGDLVCVVIDGSLIYASGKWLSASNAEAKQAQTTDFLNILLTVKKALGSRAVRSEIKLISVTETYCTELDAKNGKGYILPAYEFTFDNGMKVTVNSLDATECK